MAIRGQEHPDPGVGEVFAVGRGAGFVVVAEVTARAASEPRLADGGPGWATVEVTGGPATRPEQHRTGVVGASCGVVPPLMPRMRRIFGVADQAGLGPFPTGPTAGR
jgi:hypothetical protein